MSTQALATFGVYGRASDDEIRILVLADDFRSDLCAIHQERHEATTNYRNARFPLLWAALVEWESVGAQIASVEKRIKALAQDRIRCE